jgi:hypothetical protein
VNPAFYVDYSEVQKMEVKMIKRVLFIALFSTPMYGCVAGQSVGIDYDADPMVVAPSDSRPIQVTVTDERPFVVSGDKPPYYVGKYRAGFGNPWDVTTENRKPLADIMAADVSEELEALGFALSDAGRVLTITINDWNFDGWQNGHLWYDIEIVLSDVDGAQLYSGNVKDDVGITGTLAGIKGGVERDIPIIYRDAVQKIVRKNSDLITALSQ